MPDKSNDRFTEILELTENKIDLIEAALVIATSAYPNLNVEQYLEELGWNQS